MEIINQELKSSGKNKNKRQIILAHTSREVNNYITSLIHRNIKYKKIPNYIISREGNVTQLLPDVGYSNFFKTDSINKNAIIISLENLGWLEKVPLESYYINWIGDIYKGEIINRKWRDYFFWQPYTQTQLDKCAELCNMLMEKFSIDKKCIGHNTKTNYIDRFDGIVTRSNFDTKYTDLSPAFDFELFEKKIKNEQFA
jgi:N-acetyl-anhydromuramyl-L-alanine amidase AmpD